MPTFAILWLTLAAIWLPEKTLGVGTWTNLTTQPSEGIGICLLMSDGTVLAEGSNSNWFKLTPDSAGHYFDGTWSTRNSSSWGHQDGTTAVLTNGLVVVGGGENGNGSDQVEIYNPFTGLWSIAVNPTSFGGISDGGAMLLPNDEVMIYPLDSMTYLFNPANNSILPTTGQPLEGIGEASWVKLPNDNVLVIDSDNANAGGNTAEMYVTSLGIWTNVPTGGTMPNIWPNMTGSGDVSEMGPALLLPNGNAIFFGGNGVTAIYNNGTWSQSATIPNGLGMKDAPGAMMVNGRILLAVSPQGVNSAGTNGNGIGPTSFYEYSYTANGGAGGYTNAGEPVVGGITPRAGDCKFLDLPDGTVLLSPGGSQLYIYQPDGSPLAAGQPTINQIQWNANGTLLLTGTLFNGISQGAAYGDDEQMDSNYPLVRFISGGSVYYGTTYNWNSTSVQTGSRIVTTECSLPAAVLNSPGEYSVQVVANGIASPAVAFYAPVWVDFNYTSSFGFYFGTYEYPYNTLAEGTNAVASGGTIAIIGNTQPSVSAETMTISKPMTIISVSGPSTIGQ